MFQSSQQSKTSKEGLDKNKQGVKQPKEESIQGNFGGNEEWHKRPAVNRGKMLESYAKRLNQNANPAQLMVREEEENQEERTLKKEESIQGKFGGDEEGHKRPAVDRSKMLEGYAKRLNQNTNPAQLMVREEEEVQAKTDSENQEQPKTSAGSRTQMPEGVQAKMENSFGTHFDNVNIHTNDNSATDMGALAFTQGNNVHFAPGQYNPDTQKGQELLGHELTHVVQQRQGRVQPTKQGKGMAVNDSPGLENEADVMGAKAAQGKSVEVEGSGEGIQKQEAEPVNGTANNLGWDYTLGESRNNELAPGEGVLNPSNTYDVFVGEAGNITLVLYDTGRIRTEHTLANNMEKIRDYILKQYNWNAIVKIMKFVSDHVNDFTYENPTNISGTTADNTLIIPDAGILAIAKHQLNTAIAAHNGEITAGNIETLMRGVDGLPGNQFATSMMGETSQNTLRDEAGNTNMQREDGTDIEIPDFGSDSEETLYDFMRDLTLARNGLWSDEDSIVNLTGLRRELEISEAEDHKVQWNDTMAASWIETDEEGNEVKHCKHYTATTEPGNRDRNRMLQPQTFTVLLGLHHQRQPAGRSRNVLIRNSDNKNNELSFQNSSDFNHHPGGMRGLRGRINFPPTNPNNKAPLSGFPAPNGGNN